MNNKRVVYTDVVIKPSKQTTGEKGRLTPEVEI